MSPFTFLTPSSLCLDIPPSLAPLFLSFYLTFHSPYFILPRQESCPVPKQDCKQQSGQSKHPSKRCERKRSDALLSFCFFLLTSPASLRLSDVSLHRLSWWAIFFVPKPGSAFLAPLDSPAVTSRPRTLHCAFVGLVMDGANCESPYESLYMQSSFSRTGKQGVTACLDVQEKEIPSLSMLSMVRVVCCPVAESLVSPVGLARFEFSQERRGASCEGM